MRAVNHDDGRDHDHHHRVDGQGVPADVALAQAEVGGLKGEKTVDIKVDTTVVVTEKLKPEGKRR